MQHSGINSKSPLLFLLQRPISNGQYLFTLRLPIFTSGHRRVTSRLFVLIGKILLLIVFEEVVYIAACAFDADFLLQGPLGSTIDREKVEFEGIEGVSVLAVSVDFCVDKFAETHEDKFVYHGCWVVLFTQDDVVDKDLLDTGLLEGENVLVTEHKSNDVLLADGWEWLLVEGPVADTMEQGHGVLEFFAGAVEFRITFSRVEEFSDSRFCLEDQGCLVVGKELQVVVAGGGFLCAFLTDAVKMETFFEFLLADTGWVGWIDVGDQDLVASSDIF